MKKILFILHDTSINSGASKSFLSIIKGIDKNKFHCYVALPNSEQEMANVLEEINIPVFYYGKYFSSIFGVKTFRDLVLYIPRIIRILYYNSSSLKSLEQYCKNIKPDLIHTNVSVIQIGYEVAKKIGIPHVWHIREFNTFSNIHLPFLETYKSFHKKLLNPNNTSIAITKALHSYYQLDSKSKVIYNPVVNLELTPPEVNRTITFLYAGGVTFDKGIIELMYAFKEHLDSFADSVLHVAGVVNRKCNKIVLKYLKRNYMENNVIFLGERNDINQIMQSSKVVIIPSHNEGLGRVMIEAMNNGCLVIGNIGAKGIKEQFDNGQVLINKEIGIRYLGHQELVKSLNLCRENDIEYYSSTIINARNVVKNLYSIEENIERTVIIYDNILIKNY